jgi:hypothetical protein
VSDKYNRHKKPVNNAANYIPSLKGGNPLKSEKSDWWDEICVAHGEKNHWPKKGKKKHD